MSLCRGPGLTRSGAARAASVLCVLGWLSGEAPGQQRHPAIPEGFTIFWDVQNHGPTYNQLRIDWASQMQTRGSPVSRHVITLYHDLGLYPRNGPHEPLLDPTWMSRHYERIRTWLDWCIRDPEWDGVAVIDYEIWWPQWYFTHTSAKNNWRNYIRTHRPSLIQGLTEELQERVFEETFNDAARDFFVATIHECRRLRPRAAWGFFGMPRTQYPGYHLDTPSMRAAKENNQRFLGWMAQVSDFLAPCIYQWRCTYPEGVSIRDERWENAWSVNDAFVRSNVEEAIRLSQGKPVIVYSWVRYEPFFTGGVRFPYADAFTNDNNLFHSIDVPRSAGAAAVVLWDFIASQAYADSLQLYMDNKVYPLAYWIAGLPIPESLPRATTPFVSSYNSINITPWEEPHQMINGLRLGDGRIIRYEPPAGSGSGSGSSPGSGSGSGSGSGGSTTPDPPPPPPPDPPPSGGGSGSGGSGSSGSGSSGGGGGGMTPPSGGGSGSGSGSGSSSGSSGSGVQTFGNSSGGGSGSSGSGSGSGSSGSGVQRFGNGSGGGSGSSGSGSSSSGTGTGSSGSGSGGGEGTGGNVSSGTGGSPTASSGSSVQRFGSGGGSSSPSGSSVASATSSAGGGGSGGGGGGGGSSGGGSMFAGFSAGGGGGGGPTSGSVMRFTSTGREAAIAATTEVPGEAGSAAGAEAPPAEGLASGAIPEGGQQPLRLRGLAGSRIVRAPFGNVPARLSMPELRPSALASAPGKPGASGKSAVATGDASPPPGDR